MNDELGPLQIRPDLINFFFKTRLVFQELRRDAVHRGGALRDGHTRVSEPVRSALDGAFAVDQADAHGGGVEDEGELAALGHQDRPFQRLAAVGPEQAGDDVDAQGLEGHEGQDADRWNLLHPLETPRVPFVTRQLGSRSGPVVASTDYMKAYAEQIRPFVPKGRSYRVLGTDGFGRSDFRSKLREHFEVNRHYIVIAALKALADDGVVHVSKVAEAIAKYGINADKINPLYA